MACVCIRDVTPWQPYKQRRFKFLHATHRGPGTAMVMAQHHSIASDLLLPRESNGRFRQGEEAGAVCFLKSEWFPSLHRKLI